MAQLDSHQPRRTGATDRGIRGTSGGLLSGCRVSDVRHFATVSRHPFPAYWKTVMRALRKGQARVFALQGGIVGEARIVEHACGVGPCALTEAILWLQDHLASAET